MSIEKNWRELLKPNVVNMEAGSDPLRKSTLVVEPLERGYGITLGNALRRVLLSSLQGSAVYGFKIDGVLHEFSSISGVREDVIDIALNIKKIIWLKHGTDEGTDGHVDNIACFADENKVLALACNDKQDPFYDKLNENLEILKTEKDAEGRRLEVIEIEMSYKRLIPDDDEPSSYINFYIANGGIVMTSFDDEKADKKAQNIIKSVFPKRKILALNGIDISLEKYQFH